MDSRFLSHNTHHESIEKFSELDPDLRHLKDQKLIFTFPQLNQFPKLEAPGLYTLTGCYQTGKTTLLKRWIEKLLQENISPDRIAYISAEMIKNYHDLKAILQNQLSIMPTEAINLIIIDEISSVHDWKKAILPLLSDPNLNHIVLMLAGSVSSLALKEARMHFHLYPLAFRDAIILKYGSNTPPLGTLFSEFENYLLHGGFLKAINDIEKEGQLSMQTLKNYAEWVVKESLKRGKNEHYLREILSAVIKNYNEQTTWNALAQQLSIDHPKTIGDYFQLLESLDIVFVQYALLEDQLGPAPKKARKLMFTSPYLYHVIKAWLNNFSHGIDEIKSFLRDPILSSKLVETAVITEIKKYYPTYYIKAEGEVDLAYLFDSRFWPIEISWSNQMRAKDLKQILKYPNGRILTKTDRSGIIEHIRTEPLPVALWHLEEPPVIKNENL